VVNAIRRRWRNVVCITSIVLPEERVGREIRQLTVVAPGGQVRIGWPEQDPFIRVGKYYTDGCFQQPDIFVAEVPRARLHVASGLVCTPGFKMLADAGRLDRLPCFSGFGQRKPRKMSRRGGKYSTIHYCFASNSWHWMMDCLPKVISLERALAGEKLVLLMPDTATSRHRESMLGLLPENFSVEYLPAETWLELETFYFPSLVSGRCNGFLPPGYFAEMRSRIFARYGLAERTQPRRRLYITRRYARHRRVTNEAEVGQLLEKYAFEIVELEKLSFPQEVKLFQEAAFIIGAHGAGLASILFSFEATLLVFYATQKPPNYFHTQTSALGQRHLFIRHHGEHEDSDITVDLDELRGVLEKELDRQGKGLSQADVETTAI
jgi:hypothetical protein